MYARIWLHSHFWFFTDEYALCIYVKLKQINKSLLPFIVKIEIMSELTAAKTKKKSFKLLFEVKFIREM